MTHFFRYYPTLWFSDLIFKVNLKKTFQEPANLYTFDCLLSDDLQIWFSQSDNIQPKKNVSVIVHPPFENGLKKTVFMGGNMCVCVCVWGGGLGSHLGYLTHFQKVQRYFLTGLRGGWVPNVCLYQKVRGGVCTKRYLYTIKMLHKLNSK